MVAVAVVVGVAFTGLASGASGEGGPTPTSSEPVVRDQASGLAFPSHWVAAPLGEYALDIETRADPEHAGEKMSRFRVRRLVVTRSGFGRLGKVLWRDERWYNATREKPRFFWGEGRPQVWVVAPMSRYEGGRSEIRGVVPVDGGGWESRVVQPEGDAALPESVRGNGLGMRFRSRVPGGERNFDDLVAAR